MEYLSEQCHLKTIHFVAQHQFHLQLDSDDKWAKEIIISLKYKYDLNSDANGHFVIFHNNKTQTEFLCAYLYADNRDEF